MIRAALVLTLFCGPASAQCRLATTGAGCVTPPGSGPTAPALPGPVDIGATLPRGDHETIWEIGYYGLPSVADSWVYIRVEDDLYRVDWRTMEVLERVTGQMRRPFPDLARRTPIQPRVIDRFGRRDDGSGRHVVIVEPAQPTEKGPRRKP